MFALELIASLLVIVMIVGYKNVSNLMVEIGGLIMDLLKSIRSFTRTGRSIAEKMEVDMNSTSSSSNKKKGGNS